MVAKRQCSFCAREIEPGTGTIFVKRDGTVFQFCSSSCRKQQLHLGRIGHRFKWTRAFELKRAAARSGAERGVTAPAARAPVPSRAGTAPVADGGAPPLEQTTESASAPAPAAGAAKSAPAAGRRPRTKPATKTPAKGGARAPSKQAAPPDDSGSPAPDSDA